MAEDLRLLVQTALNTSTSPTDAAEFVGCSPVTIRRYRRIAKEKSLNWSMLHGLDDASLDATFNKDVGRAITKRMPDYAALIQELKKPGVTKMLLWEEYRESDPYTAYKYAQFTHHWRDYEERNDLTMRMWHPPGRSVYVDYSGKGLQFFCRERNRPISVQIFVGVLGHSMRIFAHATETQQSSDFLLSHAEMFLYFGGVPEFVVSDNLKAAVIGAGARRINPQYTAFADQYDVLIDPARPLRPQDKSMVENAVRIVQLWVLAKLRNMQFFSLEEINRSIRIYLDLLNAKQRRRTGESRDAVFEREEKHLLRTLPSIPYSPGTWTGKIRVDKTYHVAVDGSWYSVPYDLVAKTVRAHVSEKVVEIFLERKRVATHRRSIVTGETVTEPMHCPSNHRIYHLHSESELNAWASTVGKAAANVMHEQFRRSRPQLGIPNGSKLMALCEQYGKEAFELACARAVEIQALSFSTVKSLLQSGRYREPEDPIVNDVPAHSNIRGADYYREKTP
ncbi:IS21 family transposase [Dyella acidisoli]|uniref:Integrase n=1 Tax=Dyella acidisoli TaxID=1867834 RepID=A0ABQ5XS82_9GAMM|nr:IS21 family transposase [Dyella acidisoli]GLQ94443.1 integrase [Dyella acidisoli]